jgi:hypothetical protein
MSLSDAAALLEIGKFAHNLYSRITGKKKSKKRMRRRPRKPNKDKELAKKLIENPSEALKEMTAEYIVKNRKRLIRNVVNYIADNLT